MCSVYPVPRTAILVLSGWLLHAGIACGESPIFRCRDESGRIEFSQTGCGSRAGEPVVVKTPRIGWLKPKTRAIEKGRRRGYEEEQSAADSGAAALPSAREERCWKARQGVESLRQQLRSGYKPAQGERLRQRRRRQEEYIHRFCR